MNKASKSLILVLTIMLVILFNGCKKEFVPKLKTSEIKDITYNTAKAGGEITDDGGAAIIVKGVCWSTTTKPEISDNFTSDGTGTESFASDLSGLNPGTTYYIRAYARNSSGVGYGNEYSFQTIALSVPVVTTAEVTDITFTTANSGGNVTNDGGSTIISRGLCWSTQENPTTADSTSANGTGAGVFTGNLTGLAASTTYYVRAYATNSTGTGYGNQVSFKTNEVLVPSLTTVEISDVTINSAVSGGNITDDGGANITTRGVCWSTSQNPTTASSKIANGTGKGVYTSNLSDLTPGTTYYVRAYATNSSGTAYGNQLTFTTTPIVVPVLTTTEASDVTTSTAVTGGNITNDGGAAITSRGVCWSTSEKPLTSGSKKTEGEGSGSFTSTITGLAGGTTYYVRAYAVNSAGTAYGNQITITTESIVLASVNTAALSNITSGSVRTGGSITSNGGAEIIANGVCWSTTGLPTLEDNFTTDATSSSAFASNIAGLNDGTVYYIRAYATNSAGTSYGNQLTFITPVTDIDGNIYKTVKIGDQVWMAENLKTTKMNDNAVIPEVAGNTEWTALSTPAYSWLNNNDANKDLYGALYNWFAADAANLCPTGWHVPTDAEFNTLEIQLGIPVAIVNNWGFRGTDQGTQLKATSTWNAGGNGTNSSGFNALGGGYRQWTGGTFPGLGEITYFWSSTDDAANGNPTVGWYRRLDNTDARVFKATTEKEGGKYIRCVKD